MSDIRIQRRRRPTIAKDWQLAVLKKLRSESENPTEEQRLAVMAETGLDEKWVRNWFTRQRSRNKKGQLSTTDSPTVPTFRVQLCYPLRSSSTPIDPAPNRPANPRRQTSPAISSQPSRLTISAKTSSPSNDPSASMASSNHTTTIPTYSRDPLYHRYPDFSQFFRPQGLQRPRAFELLTPSDTSHTPLMQLLGNPNTDSHTSMHFNPLQLGGLSMDPTPSTCLQSCPVAFSMRLVDLLDCP